MDGGVALENGPVRRAEHRVVPAVCFDGFGALVAEIELCPIFTLPTGALRSG